MESDNQRDGYVYGQSVRGADAEFKAWVTAGGYQKQELMDDEGNKISFIHKSRIHPKKLHVNVTKPGCKKPSKKAVHVDQKQMVVDKTTGEIVNGQILKYARYIADWQRLKKPLRFQNLIFGQDPFMFRPTSI